MVKLDFVTSVSSKDNKFLSEWDDDMRKNHERYQTEIDKLTYHLQRSQRGLLFLGQWFYPRYFQKDLLSLELYKNKQLLGKINQEEVNIYKSINPEISQALNQTFSASWPWPKQGFAYGLGAFTFGHVLNFNYSFRAAFLLFPIAFDIFYQLGNKKQGFQTLEFLNWTKGFRTVKSRLEKDSKQFNSETLQQYKEQFKNNKTSVQDLHRQLIDLVANSQYVD